MSYTSARKEVMVIKKFQVPIDIWNDKNIPMEAKYIYSYIYSKSYKKYLVDINIGEIQQVIKIKNKGLIPKSYCKKVYHPDRIYFYYKELDDFNFINDYKTASKKH